MESFDGFRGTRGALARYGATVAIVGVALLLSLALSPTSTVEEHPFTIFYAVVMVSALVGGLGPGLLATVLSAVANYYYFLPPYGSFRLEQPQELLHAGLFLAEGALISVIATLILSAKQRAQDSEEAVRRSESHYRSLVRNASDMIALIDPNGNVLYESDSVEWLLGYKPGERVGKNVFDLIHPEDSRRLSRVFAGGRADGPVEFRVRTKRGDLRHFEAVGKDMTKDPDVGGILVDVRDVTGRKRAEAKLQETETRYRAMVERMPAITYTQEVDGDHAETFVSPQVEKMLGYTPEEYLSRPKFSLEIVHPEDQERVMAEDERTDESREPFVQEYRMIAKDGREVWVRDEAVVARGENGSPLFWQGFMLDVTEQKRAEEQSRVAAEKLRATFEQAAVGMAHVGLGGRWLKVNAKLCEILGYPAEELLSGLTFQDVTHPDDLEKDLVQARRLLAGEIGTYTMEKRYIRRDGGEVWISMTGSLVRGAAGEPAYFISVIEDISWRKQSERALRESEERLRALVQNSLDFVALCGLDGVIRYVSPPVTDSLGYEPGELEGVTLKSLIHPDDHGVSEEIYEEILKENAVRAQPIRYLRKDGSHAFLEGVFSNRASDPSVGGVVCNMRDVTEKMGAERELRRGLELLVTLRETGQVLGATLDVEEICSRLIEAAQRVAPLAAARVDVWGEAGDQIVRCSFGEDLLPTPDVPEVEAVRREAAEAGERRVLRVLHPGYRGGRMTGMCVPFRGHERVIGTLEVYGNQDVTDDRVSEILDSLANQAATALENAWLYTELGERERRLQELLAKLLTTQEEERRRVAYEVHDGLAQVAAAAHQHLQAYARRNAPEREEVRAELDLVVKLVRRTVTDARRIIANLRPTALDDFGLSAALTLEVEKLRDDGYEVEHVDDLVDERLPDACEITLFRIAQESIANLRKHTRTEKVRVDLSAEAGGARLEIRDWGQGFDPAEVPAAAGPGERVGLAGMRERTGMLGGTFEVQSSPEGTAVIARIPTDRLMEDKATGRSKV